MMKPTLSLGIAVGLTALLAGCAGTPAQNPKVEEARTLYDEVAEDPKVARSGAVQLRSAETKLEQAQELLASGADSSRVEHAAYLANRHAQIARQQGLRAELQEKIASAEARREQLMLQMKTSDAEQARKEAEQARRKTEALQEQMAALEAEKTARGMVLTLDDVLFDLNEADPKASAQRTIERLADFMKQYEERRVRIEGYTDNTGAEAYNQQLSERRALAVRDALMNQGISRSRIDVQGYGEAHPVATNETRIGRQLNRRVEIVISDETGRLGDRS